MKQEFRSLTQTILTEILELFITQEVSLKISAIIQPYRMNTSTKWRYSNWKKK